jgi:CubicO group peptidase (beta-lactamase class C family)
MIRVQGKFLVLFVLLIANFNIAFAQMAPANYFHSNTLNAINSDILNDKYGKISSIVVFQGTRLIYEKYFGFSQASTLHPISSVTKSITSIAVGICIDRGYIPSLDVKICDYFPEYSSIFNSDTVKKQITLKHLLAQTSGFEWNEWTIHYSYAGNPLIELSQKPVNWIPKTLSLPLDSLPGLKFSYNSGCSDVIKQIVEKATGKEFKKFVEENIFMKLNIYPYHWDTYPENGVPAWGGISLTTRDMAKIGILMLNKGKWGINKVVSKDWVALSMQPLLEGEKVKYGLHWWITQQNDGNPLIYAAGYGDQFVYVAPDKNLVIAINARNFTDHKWDKDQSDLINRLLSAYIN